MIYRRNISEVTLVAFSRGKFEFQIHGESYLARHCLIIPLAKCEVKPDKSSRSQRDTKPGQNETSRDVFSN